MFELLKGSFIWPGLAEVGSFMATHLISGMLPAFFIAAAIAIFLDKSRITRILGKDASPWLSYPAAAFTGGILTVCSCGVIPIFIGIRQSGAGTGPAFTFLFATPAVNLIALTYTYSFMGTRMLLARTFSVIACSIVVGLIMSKLFSEDPASTASTAQVVEEETDRTDLQQFIFFFLLVIIMLTTTGFLDSLIKLLNIDFTVAAETSKQGASYFLIKNLPKFFMLLIEFLFLGYMLKRFFQKDEIIQWLKKTWSLLYSIFPKIVLGIFVTGIVGELLPLNKLMSYFNDNSIQTNIVVALIGSMMYFGTIVGVNIVATMTHFGMHVGPALTLLLSGPTVSFPSIIAIAPLIGIKKTSAFLVLVVLSTAFCGYFFGQLSNHL
ncbi:MAG: permease [Candidatus Riflebacteria bacterium]|nr:permease [Candidatus Riflebacteria bacterium]